MSFGDADVIDAIGQFFLHDTHRATRRHGGRDTHDLLVASRQVQQRVTKHFLPKRRNHHFTIKRSVTICTIGSLPRGNVKLTRRMPNRLVVLCGRVAFAFLGDDMQHLRAAVVLDLTQDTHQPYHVMSVRRTEITDVQTREDIALLFAQCRFPVVVVA